MSYRSAAYDKDHPKNLIPELCRQFYQLGWFYGAGGAMSIIHEDKVYSSPSASTTVPIERIEHEDVFVQSLEGEDLEGPPPEKGLEKTKCLPFFMKLYQYRNAKVCIHTHSKAAVMATLLFPGRVFEANSLEMLTGIWNPRRNGNCKQLDNIVVPIIENKSPEGLLGRFIEISREYTGCHAILVRRHGVFVFGETWQQVKTMTESYDYVFDIVGRMKLHGLDPYQRPEEYELKYIYEVEDNGLLF